MSVAVVAIAVGARMLRHLVPPSESASDYRAYTITKAIASYPLPLSEAQRLCQKDLATLKETTAWHRQADGLRGCTAA
jgi:hypothetical protein